MARERQRAIMSLRASATISTRRMRPRPAPERSWNQRLSVLPGWKRSHNQATSTATLRARALPDLAIP